MARVSLVDVGNVLKPVESLIDSLFTSKEEKAAAKLRFYDAQVAAAEGIAKIQRDIIVSEIQGESKVQRNWRPHLMYVITSILAWNYVLSPLLTWISGIVVAVFKLDPELLPLLAAPSLELPEKLWMVLLFSLTGYVGLRSLFDKGGLERMFTAKNGKKDK